MGKRNSKSFALDPEQRERLDSNLGLVYFTAANTRGLNYPERVSACWLGLAYACRKFDTSKPETSWPSYAIRWMKQQIRQDLRASKGWSPRGKILPLDHHTSPNQCPQKTKPPNELAQSHEFHQQLMKAISRLSPRQQTLVICHLEGKSIASTARILNISRGYICNCKRDAMRILKTELEKP